MVLQSDLACDEPFSIPPPHTPILTPSLNPWLLPMNELNTKPVDSDMIYRLELRTHKPVPAIVRRGLVMQCGLKEMLDYREPFYVVISRSATTTHLGHLPAYQLASWLQQAFHCPVIIQGTDDASFMYTDSHTTMQQVREAMQLSLLQALAAAPFDPSNTFLYSTLGSTSNPAVYPLLCHITRSIRIRHAASYTGVQQSESLGRVFTLGTAVSPMFHEMFPTVLHNSFKSCIRVGGPQTACLVAIARNVVPTTTRHLAGLFTHLVSCPTEQNAPMNCRTVHIGLTDDRTQIENVLKHANRDVLLQLLWWFSEESDETIDLIAYGLSDRTGVAVLRKLRVITCDAVVRAVNQWNERLQALSPGLLSGVAEERPLKSQSIHNGPNVTPAHPAAA